MKKAAMMTKTTMKLVKQTSLVSLFLKIKSTMRSDVYLFHSKSSSSFSMQSKVISNKVGLRSPFENPETE